MNRFLTILSVLIIIIANASAQSHFVTTRAGIAFYNVKHDTTGVMYALPELNSNKIYKSLDSGATWTQLTSFPSTGVANFYALGCDKNNNVYAATNDGGLFKSTNGGATWSVCNSYGGGCGAMSILFFNNGNSSLVTVKGYARSINVSPANNCTWTPYLSGLDRPFSNVDKYGNLFVSQCCAPYSMYKSTNNGSTWLSIFSGHTGLMRSDTAGNLYMVDTPFTYTYFTRGKLWRSTDTGNTWTMYNLMNFPVGDSTSGVSDIVFWHNYMLVAKKQIFYSNDGGVSFHQLDSLTYTTAVPTGYGDNPTMFLDIIGDRLLVATTDGIKYINLAQALCPCNVIATPKNDSVISGSVATFSVSDTTSTATYQWQQNSGTGYVNLFDAGIYSGVNTKVLTINPVSAALNNYAYRCIRNLSSGVCADTTGNAKLIVKSTGIQNLTIANTTISPNPANASFTVNSDHTITKLDIINLLGQQVFTEKYNSNSIKVDISSLNNGIYFIRINDCLIKKLVKE